MAKKKEKLIPEDKIQETSAAIEARNLQRIEYYVALGNSVYDDFLAELTRIASRLPYGIKSVKAFSFSDFPQATKQINDLIKKTSIKVVNILNAGVDDAFLRANAKNDALVDAVFKGTGIPKKKLARYYNRNLEAAATRATKSKLSPKVYKITKQFLNIAEGAIDQGIASGKSAATLASNLRKAVKDPAPLFRRVRDEKGNLQLSKAEKAYRLENPAGTGKYYSPVKNYQRLTRTEINMSYRTADHERNENMTFIVGIRINLSTNPNHCPFCIQMQGLYPKNFLFRGWHPQCRCYRTTVLKTREELDRDNELMIAGKDPSTNSVNTVKNTPEKFNEWIKENKATIERKSEAGTLPYWYQDNFKDGKRVPGKVVGGI